MRSERYSKNLFTADRVLSVTTAVTSPSKQVQSNKRNTMFFRQFFLRPSLNTTYGLLPGRCLQLLLWSLLLLTGSNLQAQNLARNGTATQSSTAFSLPASNAIDGSLATLNHTGSTSTTEWITVDLGAIYPLGKVTIFNRIDCCSDRLGNVRVMFSEIPFPADFNASISQSIYTYTFPSNTSALNSQDFLLDGKRARYVKVQKSGTNPGGNELYLREIQVELDSDGDGITDATDVDDDNDGILDLDEGAFTVDLRTGSTAVGTTDPRWNVSWVTPTAADLTNFNGSTGGDARYLDLANYAPAVGTFPIAALVTGTAPAPGSWLNASAGSNWISMNFPGTNNGNGIHTDADQDGNLNEPNPTRFGATADFVLLKYTTTINIPSGLNASALSVPISTVTDNFSAFYVNGVFNGPVGNQFSSTTTINLTNGWQIGTNTIEVRVISGPGAVGFAAVGVSQVTQDTDGDGLPDHLDLDSDNDGCADAIEGAGSIIASQLTQSGRISGASATSGANIGLPNAMSGTPQAVGSSRNASNVACCDPAASGNTDTDGDGVADFCDVDDDNDGILDTDEGAFTFDLRTGTRQVGLTDPKWNVAWLNPTSPTLSNFAAAGVPSSYTTLANYAASTNTTPVPATVTGNKVPGAWLNPPLGSDWISYSFPGANNSPGNHYDVDFDNIRFEPIGTNNGPNGRGDYVFLRFTTTINIPAGINLAGFSLPLSTVTDNYSAFYVNGTFNGPVGSNFSNATTVNLTNGWVTGLNTITVDVISGPGSVGFAAVGLSQISKDTDGDGFADHLDFDSDNDGCPDAIEGGDNFTSANMTGNQLTGPVQTTAGSEGIPNQAGAGQSVGQSTIATKVEVNTIPANQTVVAPAAASFSISTTASSATGYTGTAPNTTPVYSVPGNANAKTAYQWYLGHPDSSGVALTNTAPYSGVKTATLNISNSLGLNGNRYFVLVTDSNNACVREIIGASLLFNTTDAINDQNSTWSNTPATGNVTTNDYDLEGNTQSFGSFLNTSGTPRTSGSTVNGVSTNGTPVTNAGTLTFGANGNYTFTPAPGFTGAVSVPYNICDNGTPVVCDTAVLDITVLPLPTLDNSVIANNDEYVMFSDTTLSGNVKLNDADPQGDLFLLTSYQYDSNGDGTPDATGTLGSPVNVGGVREDGVAVTNAGSLTLNSNGTFTFTPASGFVGTVNMKYEICDAGTPTACATALITIDILDDNSGAINNPPYAGDDFSYTSIHTPVTGNFIGNDGDPDGNPVSVNGTTINTAGPATPVTTLTTAQGGTVVIRANGTYVYTPPAGFTGPDRVEYTLCDVAILQPQPLCATATIHLLVGTENTTNAINDQNSTWINTPATGNVMTNDFDQEGNTQTFGSFLYVNGSPVSSGGTISGVNSNGTPVANAGTLTFGSNGNYTFTPTTGFTGAVSVEYNICDNGRPVVCDTAVLDITVLPLTTVDNSVIANNDEYVTYGTPVIGNIVTNDADPQGDDFSVTTFRFDSNGDGLAETSGSLGSAVTVGGVREDGAPVTNAGSLTLNSNGTFTFTPSPGFVGTVNMNYEICDAGTPTACATALFTIDVLYDNDNSKNNPPFAGDDFAYTSINAAVTGNFAGNDGDPDGNPISVNGTTINTGGPATPITTLTTEQGGSVVLNANGTFTYFPPANYVGPDKVQYEICDVTIIQPQPLCAQAVIDLLVGDGLAISGLVWQDPDGSITINNGETGTDANSTLYVNAVDAFGRIVGQAQVNGDGTYEIDAVPAGTPLTLVLSTIAGNLGASTPAPSLPAGWVNTGQNTVGVTNTAPVGIINFTTRADTIKNLNFGIEIIPTATDYIVNTIYWVNVDSNIFNPLPVLPEYFITDDADGLVSQVRLTAFPANTIALSFNGVLYTASNWPQNGITLNVDTSGKPSYESLLIYPDTLAAPSVVIPFVPIDNAAKAGLPANITISYNTILPVVLTSFKAQNNGCVVDLTWSTASETNNDRFVVYRSVDAVNWKAIATVKGNGTTPLPNTYSFADKSPMPTVMYYRLQQIDFDGGSEWLPIASVDLSSCEARSSLRVYPNPARNIVLVDVPYAGDEDRFLIVYNSAGAVVMQSDLTGQTLNEVSVQKLAPGLYIFSISDALGVINEKIEVIK